MGDASNIADTNIVQSGLKEDDGESRQEERRPPLFPAGKSTVTDRQGIAKGEKGNVPTTNTSFEQQVLARMMRPSASDS
jgi:hypothetical protein